MISGTVLALLLICGFEATGGLPVWFVLNLLFGGVVVLSWLYGGYNILYAGPGALLFLYCAQVTEIAPCNLAIPVLLTILTAPASFMMMRWAGFKIDMEMESTAKIWRVILLAGIKAAFMSFLLLHVIESIFSDFEIDYLYTTVFALTSQIFGLFVFMLVTTVTFKMMRGRI